MAVASRRLASLVTGHAVLEQCKLLMRLHPCSINNSYIPRELGREIANWTDFAMDIFEMGGFCSLSEKLT